MEKPLLRPADILLPEPAAMEHWPVVACDQYTSEPAYWHRVEHLVGAAPSTLRMILPEAFLEQPDVQARIQATHEAMRRYRREVLSRRVHGYIYVEREIAPGVVRQGLVGCVDLEDYSYEPGASPRIRPSEGTVVSRIPPRLALRRGAGLELPHILMLVDDRRRSVIEPLAEKTGRLPLVYDLPLMQQGGHIRGWEVSGESDIAEITAALARLDDPGEFEEKYGAGRESVFAAVVGDGNHSLASAKAYWEELKPGLDAAARQGHPARYCLVELGNIQSPANEIEPIHRVLFHADAACLLRFAALHAKEVGACLLPAGQGEQHFTVLHNNTTLEISVGSPANPLEAGTLEAFLQAYEQDHPRMQVDYVHGEDSVRALVKEGAVGVLLPALKKEDLFRGVAMGGVLPKKSFSMGHANQKRYYLECRQIQP